MAPKMQLAHDFAERLIGGVEEPIHLGSQASRHIPIVRLRQYQSAAPKQHPAVTERCGRRDPQLSTLLGRCRLVHAGNSCGHNERRRCEPMHLAPMLQGQCGAVVAQQIGIQCLEHGERRDARRITTRPQGAPRSRRVARSDRVARVYRHQQQQRAARGKRSAAAAPIRGPSGVFHHFQSISQ